MMLEYSKINLFEQTIFTFYCWNAKPVADWRITIIQITGIHIKREKKIHKNVCLTGWALYTSGSTHITFHN